jgi:hypothetical protein
MMQHVLIIDEDQNRTLTCYAQWSQRWREGETVTTNERMKKDTGIKESNRRWRDFVCDCGNKDTPHELYVVSLESCTTCTYHDKIGKSQPVHHNFHLPPFIHHLRLELQLGPN